MRPQIQRPTKQALQWTGDNLQEVNDLLDDFAISTGVAGGVLRLLGIGGLELTVQLGETLLLDGSSLGIIRNSISKPGDAFVIWKGSNLEEFAQFLKNYKVRMAVAGNALLIHGGHKPLILSQGDRLYNREGQIVVSIKGKDHLDG